MVNAARSANGGARGGFMLHGRGRDCEARCEFTARDATHMTEPPRVPSSPAQRAPLAIRFKHAMLLIDFKL